MKIYQTDFLSLKNLVNPSSTLSSCFVIIYFITQYFFFNFEVLE